MVTIYDPGQVVQVIQGDPPVDQTALVAQLQAQVATLTTQLAAAIAARDNALAKIAAAQAALA